MKKRYGIAVVLIIAVISIGWLLLSDFELGNYDSFEEAVHKGIPYETKDVVHTQLVEGVTVVMYTTKPDRKSFPIADYDALGVSFFVGDEKKGWKNIGPSGWDHYENPNFTMYVKRLFDANQQGKVRHHFYVVYGEINNDEIAIMETKTNETDPFKKATIISSEGKRYFLQIGEEFIIRGLSKEGIVIDQQGG
ncbi:hypothetical protein ACFQZE_00195 [Paenibacillus sp. GCM10027627]|uniref:hypothetical protein n=1 Tax=unclassified Paenibacillus TaxID=185978 RepID=UPI00363FF1BA